MSVSELSEISSPHDAPEPPARRSILWKILLPVLVLIAGLGATAALVASRKAPQRVERPVLGPLVETLTVESLPETVMEVHGTGEVRPRVSVELAPQVTGRVVSVHPSMISGGRFRAGTTLIRIDPRDYQLAVERARSTVASAETALEREQAESEAALAEWGELHGSEEAPSLVARTPQVREAQARLEAARADLASAQLTLERTRLSLPFDGLVIEESVAPGQLVSSGQRVATVFGTEAVEVRVPLEDSELAWIDLPAPGRPGAAVKVSADFAGARREWPGRVDRLEGLVDARSRMVSLVVVVEDPFAEGTGRPPLLPGTFVDVAIEGRRLEDVKILPRHALHSDAEGGGTVWVVAGETLDVRSVEVLRRERERVYVGGGLEAGERVVVSALDAVTDGMAVRIEAGEAVNDG